MTFVAGDPGQHLVVSAERAQVDPASDVAHLWVVSLTFEGDDGGLSLTCDAAEVALGGQHFRLEGDVRGLDAHGRAFTTEWLAFDGVTERLWTEAPVEVVDGGARYSGEAFEYDVAERRLTLLGGARVERNGER